ncbi:acylphosphatase [Noviherbaspirillum sp. UKPF54]|uniref:acylphosphatase n=1 Tax=Noviherbaspirillum sp. UKPF54 TaxID=2601898 RepID=UPI0011B10F9D|nr:acylphosphatase [Noviherbaspirillum sp. UKPF54]QDZ30203.1 acylphosphatase [Noviherbaspirillum sp. UKPF54]
MARHLVITGLVQGVGYRASFEAQARALRLCGWVRNRRDGSVEAMVRGDDAALEKIVAWSRRGPAAAVVSDVKVNEADDVSLPDDRFEVRQTE